jgi:hypothetical protein
MRLAKYNQMKNGEWLLPPAPAVCPFFEQFAPGGYYNQQGVNAPERLTIVDEE